MRRRAPLLFGALLVAMAAGCPFSFTNEEHCAAQDGDASCTDPSRPFCALDGCSLYDEVDNRTGCVAEEPTDLSCYSPCGGKQDANARSECSTPDTESTSVATTVDTDVVPTEPTTTDVSGTDTDPCNCGPEAPVCVDGACEPCVDDTACIDAGLPPICDDGQCIECRPIQADNAADDDELDGRQPYHVGCTADTPNCDAGVCVPKCLFHDECPGSGCDFTRGLCGPNDTRFYVDANTGSDEPKVPGSQGAPFATVGHAIEEVAEASGGATAIVTVIVSEGSYAGPISTGRRAVILLGDPEGERPQFSAADDTVFDVAANASLSLGDVRVQESELVARVRSTGRFFADGVEMVNNISAVRIEQSAGFVRNSVLTGSTEAPFILAPNGELGVMTTTIIGNEAASVFACESRELNRISFEYSIAGEFVEVPEDWALLGPLCSLVPGYPVLTDNIQGVLPNPGSFIDGSLFRLDAGAADDYEAEARPEACELGAQIEDAGFLLPCPPDRDVDGVLRPQEYWRGFSANP